MQQRNRRAEALQLQALPKTFPWPCSLQSVGLENTVSKYHEKRPVELHLTPFDKVRAHTPEGMGHSLHMAVPRNMHNIILRCSRQSPVGAGGWRKAVSCEPYPPGIQTLHLTKTAQSSMVWPGQRATKKLCPTSCFLLPLQRLQVTLEEEASMVCQAGSP